MAQVYRAKDAGLGRNVAVEINPGWGRSIQDLEQYVVREMVGPCGLEPQTSTVSRWRSSQLSYGPTDR